MDKCAETGLAWIDIDIFSQLLLYMFKVLKSRQYFASYTVLYIICQNMI